jgi:hypothetical protein
VDRRLEEMADRELTEPAAANEGIRLDLGGMLWEGDEFDASASPCIPAGRKDGP